MYGHNLAMPTSCANPVPSALPTAVHDARPGIQVVVMGVSGCGKSAVAHGIALRLALPLIEGDDFHPASNILKMQQGTALTDGDRAQWLHTLGQELARHPQGVVLTCSALKATYRSSLRAAAPRLRFVHLAITQAESLRRVGSRPGHFYPPSLVASQFEALQDPAGEYGVLSLAGSAPPEELAQKAATWLIDFEFSHA